MTRWHIPNPRYRHQLAILCDSICWGYLTAARVLDSAQRWPSSTRHHEEVKGSLALLHCSADTPRAVLQRGRCNEVVAPASLVRWQDSNGAGSKYSVSRCAPSDASSGLMAEWLLLTSCLAACATAFACSTWPHTDGVSVHKSPLNRYG